MKLRKTNSNFWKCFTIRKASRNIWVCGRWKQGDRIQGIIIDIPRIRFALGNSGVIF